MLTWHIAILKITVSSFPALTTPSAAIGGDIPKSAKVIWFEPFKIKFQLLAVTFTTVL